MATSIGVVRTLASIDAAGKMGYTPSPTLPLRGRVFVPPAWGRHEWRLNDSSGGVPAFALQESFDVGHLTGMGQVVGDDADDTNAGSGRRIEPGFIKHPV